MTNTAYAGNSTDVTVEVRGFVASTGLPYTAGAHNTAGIAASYIRNRGASTAISLVTQTANGAHTDGGFVHVAAGIYRLDLPDAAVASGADDVVIQVSGITDVVFTVARIEILGSDPRSATVAANVTSIEANVITAASLAADAATEIANATVEAEWTAFKSLARTGTNGNGGLAITMPTSGAQTSTIATNANALPVVDFG